MSEQVRDLPAPRNPFARLLGVITSPGESFEEIARKPGWLPPLVCYLVIFFLALGFFSIKADWVAIDTYRIESLGLTRFLPEEALDRQIQEQTDQLRKLTPAQAALKKVVENGTGAILSFHVMALIYSTLFVMMGSLTKMRLGRAWLNFLLCLLVYAAFGVVVFIANTAFADAPGSALLLSCTAALLMMGGWIWLLDGAASRDEELNRMLSVCTYSSAVLMISALCMLAVAVVSREALVIPPEKVVPSNLGALIKSDVPVLESLLGSLDLFVLWLLVLLTAGFRAATRLSTGVAASITFLPWAVIVMIKIAWAAVTG